MFHFKIKSNVALTLCIKIYLLKNALNYQKNNNIKTYLTLENATRAALSKMWNPAVSSCVFGIFKILTSNLGDFSFETGS